MMAKKGSDLRLKRILFVDDEPDVLSAAAGLLRLSGYDITTAQTQSQVEEQLQGGQFDVVLTDLTMPESSGWDVAHRSKQLWPDKPVVLVTGWGLQLNAHEMQVGHVDGVLAKPFTVEEFAQTLANLPWRQTASD